VLPVRERAAIRRLQAGGSIALLAMALQIYSAPVFSIAQAADPAPPGAQSISTPPGDELAQVTVEARRKHLEEDVKTFVDRLTHSSRFSSETVPRWRAPLCFMVAGLPRAESSFVALRLTQIAVAAGAQVRAKGCTRKDVNFYVVFTPDPARTLHYLDIHPALLFDSDASRPQIDQFLNPKADDVVRIWHNAMLSGANGQTLIRGQAACASMGRMLVNCDGGGGSRVSVSAVQQFTEAVVIVDSKRTVGLTMEQLSDYVAMVGLADFSLKDSFGDAPTILRLFTQPPEQRPPELTSWDRAFLSALYGTDQRAVTQRDRIADSIVHDVTAN
jgi:hypothetical protein